jgi:hypothetical protein
MNRRGKKFVSVAAVSLFVLVLYLSPYTDHTPSPSSTTDYADTDVDVVTAPPQRGDPKITIIVPWWSRSSGPLPHYVPYFFNSVEANPSVDLLYVHITDSQDDCTPLWDAPNVKVCPNRLSSFDLAC